MSRFRVTHGMLVLLLRQAEDDADPRRGYREVATLIGTQPRERPRASGASCASAAQLFRALRAADIVRLERDAATGRRRVRVADDLQPDFSLHHTLSLYLVEAISYLEARDELRARACSRSSRRCSRIRARSCTASSTGSRASCSRG